jgi:hypothetical protein
MPELANEWTELVERWREVERPVPLDGLRKRIATERRRMLLWLAADVMVSLAFVVVVPWMLWRYPGAWSRTFAADVGVLLAGAWGFTLWNRRGLWQPLGETTESYLALARLRCTRRLHAIRFGWAFLIAQVTFVAVWAVLGPRGGPLSRAGMALAAGLPMLTVAGFAVGLSYARRRALRELAELGGLRKDGRGSRP